MLNHRIVLTFQNDIYIELVIKNDILIVTFSKQFDLLLELKLALLDDLYLDGYNSNDEEATIVIKSQTELELDDANFEIYLTSTIHKELKKFNNIKEF